MKRKRFTEEQIHEILKESEAGMATPEVCRKYGISKNTFYNWRSKYSGMELSDLKKMRQLEDENTKLKKLVAEQALDIQAMKAVLSKKW
ncbi:MAG: transposase [Spirochaetes bacterium]|nr:transposase [Spirochaetota bacterium]